MGYIEIIGLCAGFFSTFSTLPQIIKVWRERSARDISLFMFLMWWTSTILWMIYGLLTGSIPLVMANTVTCVLVFLMILMKVKFG